LICRITKIIRNPRNLESAVNMLLDAAKAQNNDGSETEAPRRQVAALPWQKRKGVVLIALVNSRETGRLVLPKGWPEKGLTDPQAAEQEAFEEAGLKGKISTKFIGTYEYVKIIGPGFALPCIVDVYPLVVKKMLNSWPERAERARFWMTPEDAAKRVAEPALADLLRSFKPN
jgi:8-oxo-dGTP pyrophosphatase MutT (NUDIX family)